MSIMDVLKPQQPPEPKNISFRHSALDEQPRYEVERGSKEKQRARERIEKRRLEKEIKKVLKLTLKERERKRKKLARAKWPSTRSRQQNLRGGLERDSSKVL